MDNRSAFGNALIDIAKATAQEDSPLPMAVFDCDLASSVKTAGFAKQFPNHFFQGGIQEHNTAKSCKTSLDIKSLFRQTITKPIVPFDTWQKPMEISSLPWVDLPSQAFSQRKEPPYLAPLMSFDMAMPIWCGTERMQRSSRPEEWFTERSRPGRN